MRLLFGTPAIEPSACRQDRNKSKLQIGQILPPTSHKSAMVPFFGQVTLNCVGARLGSKYTKNTWGEGVAGEYMYYGEGEIVEFGEGHDVVEARLDLPLLLDGEGQG